MSFGMMWAVKITVYIAFIKRVIKTTLTLTLSAVKPMSESNINTTTSNMVFNIWMEHNVSICNGCADLAITVYPSSFVGHSSPQSVLYSVRSVKYLWQGLCTHKCCGFVKFTINYAYVVQLAHLGWVA